MPSIEPDDLDRLVGALDEDPGLAVVSPRLVGPDGRTAGRLAASVGVAAPGARPCCRGPGPELAPNASRDGHGCPVSWWGRASWCGGQAFDAARRVRHPVLAVRRGGRPLRAAGRCRLGDRGWSADAVADHEGGASAEGIEDLVFEHFQRGPEHFVAKRGGGRAVLSLRLAELVGSVIRIVAPGSGRTARRTTGGASARLARRAAPRSPGRVPLDSPATAAVGRRARRVLARGVGRGVAAQPVLRARAAGRRPEPPRAVRRAGLRRRARVGVAASGRRHASPGLRPLARAGRPDRAAGAA